MKRFIALCLGLVMIIGLAFAGIEKFDVEDKMKVYIRTIYNESTGTAIAYGRTLQDAKDLVTAHGTLLESADKTKLVSLEMLINTAKAACEDVSDFIDINWSAISEE